MDTHILTSSGSRLKKKILFISHSSDISGAEKCLVHLLQRLQRDLFEPMVLLPSDGPLNRIIQDLGIATEVHSFPLWIAAGEKYGSYFKALIKNMPKRVHFLRNFIKFQNIDLVYTNTIACIDGAIAAKLEKVPHIWHIHEVLWKSTYIKSYLPHSLLKIMINYLSHVVIVPSDAVKRHYEIRYYREKINKIYNGVDIHLFDNINNPDGKDDFRVEMGLKKQKIVALIGYFNPGKGQDDFVDAAKIVSGRFEDAVFLFVGDGVGDQEFNDAVKRKVKSLRLEDKFIILGFRNNIEKIMKSIDIFVLASHVESFSNVLCEAMAAWKPVVATRCGGPEEIVLDGNTGLLVPVKTPDKLAEAIMILLGDEKRAMKMGLNGRRRVEEVFTIEQYAKNIENLLITVN